MKIMIVDDALFLRVTLRSILERNGFEVVGEATNGREAIEKYEALNPDLVTMDITMPKLNGMDAMVEILGKHPHAKIVMCSAMGRDDFQEEAFEKGAVGFITKPFDEEKIVQSLKNIEL